MCIIQATPETLSNFSRTKCDIEVSQSLTLKEKCDISVLLLLIQVEVKL